MRRNCCHVSLAFLLKFLNFLQAFIGVSIILYSVWMLDQWENHIPISPPPSAPSPDSSSLSLFLHSEYAAVSDQITVDLVSGFDGTLGLTLHSFKLPAPWFIYSFMGDLPFDPTSELQRLRSFIEANVDICKWVGVTVVVIQALSLLLAVVLRGMVSTRRVDYDGEDDYDGRATTREPLLNPQSSQASGSTKVDGRGTHSDIWSTRIRDKYGLNSAERYGSLNQNASKSMKSNQ